MKLALKVALGTAVFALLVSTTSQTGLAEEAASSETAASTTIAKKHAWLADKTKRQKEQAADIKAQAAYEASLNNRVGKPPTQVLNIFNTWTHETVAIDFDPSRYRSAAARKRIRTAAQKSNDAKQGASWHLRCHFTNEPTSMDARLFQVLVEAAHHFKVPRVEIISGFRAPKYNLTLRKKGRQVARRSHHTLGEAVDFRLPGISTPKLRNWAKRLKLGGVGYYPSSGFVHVDVGKIRTWRGD